MTRREQRIGKAGEEWVAPTLRGLGVEMVEKIGTPVRLISNPRIPGYFRVIYGERVSGDHRGILLGGRSVLAETKTILDHNLQWSDLRKHQPVRLSQHVELGGLSLLVWVHSSGIYTMRWPVEGFGPGKSISPERAQSLAIISLLA
jgi:hypothetical protein